MNQVGAHPVAPTATINNALNNNGLEVFRHTGAGASHFPAHHTPRYLVGQTLVHGLHTYGGTGLNGGVHLRDLVHTDEVSDCRSAAHDGVRRSAERTVCLPKRLSDNRAPRR